MIAIGIPELKVVVARPHFDEMSIYGCKPLTSAEAETLIRVAITRRFVVGNRFLVYDFAGDGISRRLLYVCLLPRAECLAPVETDGDAGDDAGVGGVVASVVVGDNQGAVGGIHGQFRHELRASALRETIESAVVVHSG